jgi:hypothetical protein
MTSPLKFLCLWSALALTPAAFGAQWFALSARDSGDRATVMEVDLQSVRVRDGSGDADLRVSYDVIQTHPGGFGYRSFIATANIDCARRTLAMTSAAYFALPAGQGVRVGADSSARGGGMPEKIAQSVPLYARQALLRAACSTSAPGS